MKKIWTLAIVSACATAPASLITNVSPSKDATACPSSKLSSMGYTVYAVESANKDFGLVMATKRDGGGGEYFVTTVNVALFEEGGIKKMRVTSDLMHYYNGGRATQALGATKYTTADAQAILDACGTK